MSLGAELGTAEASQNLRRQWITPITVSLVLVSLTTALLWLLQARLKQEHLIFVYFMPTTLIAVRYGSISAMCVTIASSFAAAYFLYPPRFSFFITNPLQVLELTLFSMLALLASQVVAGFANDIEVEKRRERRGSLLSRDRLAAMTARLNRAGD